MSRFVRTKYQQYKRDTQELSTWLARTALEYGFSLDSFEAAAQPDAKGRTTQQMSEARRRKEKKARQKARKREHAAAEESGNDRTAAGEALAVDAGGEEREAVEQTRSGEEKDAAGKAKAGNGGAQAASAGSKAAPMQGSYTLKVRHYAEIARFLVSEDVAIPTQLMHLLHNCIQLRLNSLRRFLKSQGDSELDDSTRTHGHFIDALQEVKVLFTEHRLAQSNAAAVAKGEGQAEPEAGTTPANRFAKLAELDVEEVEDEEETADILLPEPSRPAGASASTTAQVSFDLEESRETALLQLLTFFDDMRSVREYIKELWLEFKDNKVDLLTAAVTSNTALELLRRPHEDVVANLLPFFHDDAFAAAVELCDFMYQYEGKDPLPEQLPWYNELAGPADTVQDGYERFFLPQIQILELTAGLLEQDHNNEGIPLFSGFPDGDFDPSLDYKTASFETRWKQGRKLLLESMFDYVMLERYLPKRRADEKGASLTHAELERLPFAVDEMAVETAIFSRTTKHTLLLALHCSVLIDVNFALGSSAARGHAELQAGSPRMLASLEERDAVEGDVKPELWTSERETYVSIFKHEAFRWTAKDPVTVVRQEIVCMSNQMRNRTRKRHVSPLMQRNPPLSGVVLFRLQLKYQRLGMALANIWGTVIYCAHLVVACRHSGSPPSEPPSPQWPDMDKILEMHKAEDIFGDVIPHDLNSSLASYLRLNRSIPMDCRLMAQLGIKIENAKGKESRLDVPKGTNHADRAAALTARRIQATRMLVDHTQLLPIFQSKYLDNGSRVNIETIEQLLSDIRARDEPRDNESELDEAAKSLKSKAQTRNQLRKQRSHSSAKFSVPQLLAVLEAGLRSETESIRFDYVSMHVWCLRALKAVRLSAGAFLHAIGYNLPENNTTLTANVGIVLNVAAIGKLEYSSPDASDVLAGTLLADVTNALKEFLSSSPDEASKELSKLRLSAVTAE